MNYSDQEILDIFTKTDALMSGHFVLTSGLHSNQYFQCAKVLQHPKYAEAICSILVDHFKNYNIDTVIAPAVGGIVVGQEVARQLNKRSIFAERKDGRMTLRRGFTLEKGEKALLCEDVVTTGGSVVEVMDIVKEQGAEIVGVGMIVDRSNGTVDFGVPQKSTLQLKVETWKEDELPDELKNIPVEKPGSRSLSK